MQRQREMWVSFCAVAMVTSAAAGQVSLDWETTVSVTSELEGGDDLVVDAEGNVLVIGDLNVERDFYVIKFDASGDLVWSRIIGGNSLDYVRSVALDDAGDVYLTGRTLSSDFPTLSAYQNTLNGPSDAFVMKLSGQTGSTLFSTFFGGSRSEGGNDIALGSDGSLYLAGHTDSLDLETVNPIQGALTLTQCFCDDAFIARFSPQIDELTFSTYLGGAFDDEASEIEVDAAGNIYFAGRTKSADWPTLNAVQPTMGGGQFDMVAGKISAHETLGYSTYLGGEDWELLAGMAIDDGGNMYLGGSTRSIFFPTTPGAFGDMFVGGIGACPVPFGPVNNCFDWFVTKLSTDGSTMAYSTFVGGHREDEPRNLVVDDDGRAILIGYTYSHDFPTGAPFGTVVVARLNGAGSDLESVLTHDTPGSNGGSGVAVDGRDIYITASVGLPYDTYVAKFSAAIPGDIDEDDDIDLADFAVFRVCTAGPGITTPPQGCDAESFANSDLDGDGDVDNGDFSVLQRQFTPEP